jgi:hypothetical protein
MLEGEGRATGELKAFYRAFKEARKVDSSHPIFRLYPCPKAAMLEALAREDDAIVTRGNQARAALVESPNPRGVGYGPQVVEG